jgi:hypothetical protein
MPEDDMTPIKRFDGFINPHNNPDNKSPDLMKGSVNFTNPCFMCKNKTPNFKFMRAPRGGVLGKIYLCDTHRSLQRVQATMSAKKIKDIHLDQDVRIEYNTAVHNTVCLICEIPRIYKGVQAEVFYEVIIRSMSDNKRCGSFYCCHKCMKEKNNIIIYPK